MVSDISGNSLKYNHAKRKKIVSAVFLLIISVVLFVVAFLVTSPTHYTNTVVINGESYNYHFSGGPFTDELFISIITIAFVFLVFSILLFVSAYKNNRGFETPNQSPINPDKTDEKQSFNQNTELRCEYCNGIILKTDTACDHCGAKVIDRSLKRK